MRSISIIQRPRRAITAFAALAAVAAIAPAAASADGSIGWNNVYDPLTATALDFVADQGSHDKLVVTFSDGGSANYKGDDTVRFESTGSNIKRAQYNVGYSPAFTQCYDDSPKVVTCQADAVTQIRYWTWDKDDTIDHQAALKATINAGAGNDTLIGGSSNDELHGEEGHDDLYGRGGYDSLDGGKDYDVLDGGLGGDTIDGGDGTDQVTYWSRTAPVSVDLTSASGDGESGEGDNVMPTVESITGGKGADTLKGNGEANMILGREGADELWGRGGDDDLRGMEAGDKLYGEAGDDDLWGAGGGDVAYGGAGEDLLSGSSGADYLYGEQGADSLSGSSGADFLYGGAGVYDDKLNGGGQADMLTAGPGVDTVTYAGYTVPVNVTVGAGNGNDGAAGEGDTVDATIENVIGGNAGDTMAGSPVANLLQGGPGPDDLTGNGGADQILGESGADTLRAQDGIADGVNCGANNDTAFADPVDTLTACESVNPGQGGGNVAPGGGNGGGQNGGGGNGGGGPSGGGAKALGPKMGIALVASRLTKSGHARVRITCPKSAKSFCKGLVRLQRHRAGSKPVKIALRSFALKSGGKRVVYLKVGASTRKLMGKTRTVRAKGLRLRITAEARALGTVKRTTSKDVRVKRAIIKKLKR